MMVKLEKLLPVGRYELIRPATNNIKNVYICNPKNHKSILNKFENIKETVNNILEKSNHKTDVKFICEEDIESTVKISDIIVTATPSEKAMIKSEWVKEGTHFSCMGACMEGKQEIDVNLFENAVVYADDKGQCFKSGELQNAYKENIVNDINGEIGELILNNKKGRTSDEEITIFDSTGLFIQDLATSIEILEKSNELNIGSEVEQYNCGFVSDISADGIIESLNRMIANRKNLDKMSSSAISFTVGSVCFSLIMRSFTCIAL